LFFKYSLNLLWENHLDFFSQNPSKEEVRRFFSIPVDINDWGKPREIHDGFYNVILELFYDEFTDENVVKLYNACNMKYSISLKAFIKRYFSIIDGAELMRAYSDDIFYSNINTSIFTEVSVRFGKTIDICYVSTRNAFNELFLDRLVSLDSETILEQLKNYPKTRIFDLELMVNVMNSDLIGPKLRLKILTCFLYSYSYGVVELLVKETIQPINFIEYENEYFSGPVYTKIKRQVPKKIFLEFVDSVNDPLICLMILDSNFSPEAKRIIQQKRLNLNRIYIFDLEIEIGACKFVARTMHFKQILKELNYPELNEAFNLDSNDLNHDYSTINDSLPVIIFDKDYIFTPNSN
jgi:hypothetical protein